ncbi:MAG: glycoside hydrolase family 127 protein, partial [Armatimonadota bacterium]|nr:glycoside hydrolase family 127 protein [Armatimonadota bacterium]
GRVRDYGLIKTAHSPHAVLRSVDLCAVHWRGGFWAEQLERCRQVTLPHLWRLAADPNAGHALTNLRIAAGLEEGEFAGTHWQDEWIYKWLEAASALYAYEPQPELDRHMDEVIAVIARAQRPDGYLATQTIVRGWKRWQDIHHHELYVMGHLITAACLHHRVTGKENFLAVARKAADCVWETFRGRDPALAHFPFNPTIIMAGVELFRTTGEERYLQMASLFVEMRGSAPGGSDLNQDYIPLRRETEVVGHAVLFGYLYAGAADVYLETGDHTLLEALERLWRDLTERKTYVNGGTCAIHRGLSLRWPGDGRWPLAAHDVHEAAGPPYELPNSTAYNETCAQIANLMWNWRMLAIRPEARFADAMERALYNGILPGIGLDGASWFYTNPLRWYGSEHFLLSQDAPQRFQPGRNHICCPTNLLRTIAQWHAYAYSVSDDTVWVHHYGANALAGCLPNGDPVELLQETAYPWAGEVTFTLRRMPHREVTLALRVPGWATGATLQVNDAPAIAAPPGTYA